MTISNNMLLKQQKSGEILEHATPTVQTVAQQNYHFNVIMSCWLVIPLQEISGTVKSVDPSMRVWNLIK
jgi:hypothetical protein